MQNKGILHKLIVYTIESAEMEIHIELKTHTIYMHFKNKCSLNNVTFKMSGLQVLISPSFYH